MKIRTTAAIGVIAGVALLVSGCTESSKTTTTEPDEHADQLPARRHHVDAGAATTRPSTSGRSRTPAAKPARRTGTPITIGYANQEDVFPEATIGIDAAVEVRQRRARRHRRPPDPA